jgi:hypothetical protein
MNTNIQNDPYIPRLPPRAKEGDEYKPIGLNDLFVNPMVQNALENMPEDVLANYKRVGEELYSIDFEDIDINNMPKVMTDAVSNLEIQLRSGLHPSLTTENERNLLKEAYGAEWYKKWDYTIEDLENIN